MTISAYPTSATHEIIPVPCGYSFRQEGQLVEPANDAHDLALLHRIKAGDGDTRRQLVTGNLLHVLRSSKRYARSGAGIFDLLKAGDKGLAHALEHFKPDCESRFSAYAASCIRQHIERALGPQRMPATLLPRVQRDISMIRSRCA